MVMSVHWPQILSHLALGAVFASCATSEMSASAAELSALGDSPDATALVDALQSIHRAAHTVSFTQRAVSYEVRDGEAVESGVQTMKEWLRIPGWLRIDLNEPEPTSVIFHPQGRSLITASERRDGETGSTVMLLMLDIFGQDSEIWLARVEAAGLDTSIVSRQQWDDEPAWVLGAGPGQLDRTQLWLDGRSLLPVRYLEVQQAVGGETSTFEGRASAYEDFHGVPFHTRFELLQDGALRLVESYEDVVVDGELSADTFDLQAIAAQLGGGGTASVKPTANSSEDTTMNASMNASMNTLANASSPAVGAAPAAQGGGHVTAKLLPPGVVVPRKMDLFPASPHVAVGDSGEVAVTYAAGNQVWVSMSPDGGEHFVAPVRVGARGKLGKGPSRGPKIAIGPRAMVIVAICGDELMGQDGDLLSWRSTDHGASWDGPVRVNDKKDAPREGLAALAAAPDGTLLSVWLDLRKKKGTELWGAWSQDGGKSWRRNTVIYRSPEGSICQCCHPSVTFDPENGDALVMWRNDLKGDRDMYVVRIHDQDVGEAQRLGSEHWPLEGCPQAGGGLAVSATGKVYTAWRRYGDLYRASPGRGELRLASGEHVRVGVGPQGASYLWRERAMLHAMVAGEERTVGEGDHPWLAWAPDGLGPVVAVWEGPQRGPAKLRLEVLQER